MQNIAIFGGTFNPIHFGHLLIAEAALNQFELEQVIWVPTYFPPHKFDALVEFQHRLEMVRRAIADHPKFLASDVDAYIHTQQSGASYAIDTLQSLNAYYPNTRWHWIVGMDAFQSLPKWRSSSQLAAHCVWLVAPRTTDEGECLGQQVADQMKARSVELQWRFLQFSAIAISSSLIRQYCATGRSIDYLVPESVRCYIATQNLYQMS